MVLFSSRGLASETVEGFFRLHEGREGYFNFFQKRQDVTEITIFRWKELNCKNLKNLDV